MILSSFRNMRKVVLLNLVLPMAFVSLMACGISADVHDAVIAEKDAAQASVTQLQTEKKVAQDYLDKLQTEKKADQVLITELQTMWETNKAAIIKLETEKKSSEDSIAQLEKQKKAGEDSIAQLEKKSGRLETDLTKAESWIRDTKAVYPAKRFKDRSDLEIWLRKDDISERPDSVTVEALYQKALELQARALTDGYTVNADFSYLGEGYYFVWLSAVVENSDYFTWNPESDEVVFSTNINQFPAD